ncbi:MAG: type IV secretion system DNA-binding domain-containing protein [Patescibacteria group bacterium]
MFFEFLNFTTEYSMIFFVFCLSLGFLIIGSLIFFTRKIFIDFQNFWRIFDRITLCITVPKEAGKGEKGETEKKIIEQLAPMEIFFGNLHGLRTGTKWKNFLFGQDNWIAFEIVCHKGLIKFYITTPRSHQSFIEQQIHAQFSMAHIEEVADYNIFSPTGAVEAAVLGFSKQSIFPIKTYKKLEIDPLNALTNSLSKIKENDEGVAIQILIEPAGSDWRKSGFKVASEMHQGKKIGEALKTSNTNYLMKATYIFLDIIQDIFIQSSGKNESIKTKEAYRLSPMEEELVKALEEKASKAEFKANVRIVSCSDVSEKAKQNLKNIVNSFSQYRAQESNNCLVKLKAGQKRIITDFIYRNFHRRREIILNTEELTSIFHFPLLTTETPNILWLLSKKAACPVNIPREGIILGKNIYRNQETLIRIKKGDRRRHVYIIGKSGVGKSVLISNMAKQDIQNGEGVCVVDPHGDLVEDILTCIPKDRIDDVIYFNPSDTERPIGLNMLESKAEDQKDFAVQEMIAIFYKLFPPEMIGPMFEHNMRNVMLTLMSDLKNPGTIAEIPRMFTDTDFQKQWVAKLKDPIVRAFWEKEMAKTSDFHKSEMLGYLISKVGRFVENEMMRNIIGQSHSGFDFREVMDKKKILLINLAKGKTGEVNSNLLGLIIISKLQMAAMGRADLPEEQRNDFYLYVDEFQNFITDSIATILSEARKYRLDLIIAHQYVGQLVQNNDTKIRDAVFGNVGTTISFKIGVEDTEILAKEFAPIFNEYDLINVEQYNAYIKLLIDNQASKAFNMQTIPPQKGNLEIAQKIKELSRLKYGRDKEEVEDEILERTQLGESKSSQNELLERTL